MNPATYQSTTASDIGSLKVEATAAAAWQIDPQIKIETVFDRFRARQALGPAVICCVDPIASRGTIWRSAWRGSSPMAAC